MLEENAPLSLKLFDMKTLHGESYHSHAESASICYSWIPQMPLPRFRGHEHRAQRDQHAEI